MNDKRTPAIEATVYSTYRNVLGNSDAPNWDAADGGALELKFGNGETILISTNNLAPSIQIQAMVHGLKQKLVDAAALSRNPDTGRSATIDDKYNAVREVYDRLLAGNWNKGRGDSSSTGNGGLLFRALCQMYPNKTPEALRAFLDGKTKSECAALRATPKIAAIIDTLRAPSGDIDTDDLLSELG